MNRIERAVRAIDRFQQRHTVPAFLFAVVKKFGDDSAGVLATNLAYSAFAAVFPLLLLMVTVLGIVLKNNPSLQHQLLQSTLRDFPVIGAELENNIHALQRGSTVALVVSILGLVWASTGLAQAGLYTMAQVWNLPGPQRLNYFKRLLRSLAFLGVLALGIAVTTGLASIGTFAAPSWYWIVGAQVLAVVVNIGQYFLAFRVLTPSVVESRKLWPGAIFGGVAWTGLQAFGGFLVGHTLKNTSEVYGTFAIVLGLLAWIYLGVQMSIYAAELNTVVAGRLWPRSIVPPPLTDADKRVLAAQATQQQRLPGQRVRVSYGEAPDGEGYQPEPSDGGRSAAS
jgi:YihY family inner membrane protein